MGGGGESQEKKRGKKRKWREEERERRSREIRSQLETNGGKMKERNELPRRYEEEQNEGGGDPIEIAHGLVLVVGMQAMVCLLQPPSPSAVTHRVAVFPLL